MRLDVPRGVGGWMSEWSVSVGLTRLSGLSARGHKLRALTGWWIFDGYVLRCLHLVWDDRRSFDYPSSVVDILSASMGTGRDGTGKANALAKAFLGVYDLLESLVISPHNSTQKRCVLHVETLCSPDVLSS